MLSFIGLENFKACRDLDARLAPLTLLAGLNSSGKSTILQALSVLKQGHDEIKTGDRVSLSGDLVQLGKFGDVRSEGAGDDAVSIFIVEDSKSYRWTFRGEPSVSQPKLEVGPTAAPNFVASSSFQFLQADRIVPSTLYPQASQRTLDSGFLGPRGEYTVGFLGLFGDRPVDGSRRCPAQIPGVSDILLRKIAPTNGLRDQVAGWLQYISPGARLDATPVLGTDEVLLQFGYVGVKEDPGTIRYRPTNVGFGLTYSLPIIVACLAADRGGLLLLENPEAHLHPRGQAALGDLLARCANDGVQVIVETHSDHVLNGVRVAVKRKRLSPEKVALNFFSRRIESGDAFVQSPAILEDGRMSNWPEGFFDQWDKDVTALLD